MYTPEIHSGEKFNEQESIPVGCVPTAAGPPFRWGGRGRVSEGYPTLGYPTPPMDTLPPLGYPTPHPG